MCWHHRRDAQTSRSTPGRPLVSFVPLVSYYVSFEIKSKIGMYIAMTIPPTTVPRIAIMIGSSRVNSPATAVSTSSS